MSTQNESDRKIAHLAALVLLAILRPDVGMACTTTVEAVLVPSFNTYLNFDGAPQGKIAAGDLPKGTAVVDCAQNGRVQVISGGTRFWIDGYAVLLSDPNAGRPIPASPSVVPNVGGGAGVR